MNDFEKEDLRSGASEKDAADNSFISSDGLVIKEASFKKRKRAKKEKKSVSARVKTEKKKTGGFFSLKYPGVIISFLMTVIEKVAQGLKKGFFGNLFSSLYLTENGKFKNGFLNNMFKGSPVASSQKVKKPKKRTRIAAMYEGSLLYSLITGASRWLMHSYVRLWGVLFVSFGTMLEIVLFIRYFLIDKVILTENFWVGLIMIILSLPLLSSGNRLGDVLRNGASTRYLLIDFMEIEEEKLQSDPDRFGGYYSAAFVIGTVFGLVSYFVSPMIVVGAFISLVAFLCIMFHPELGMMMILFLIPFASVFKNPSIVIMVFIMLDLLSFAFKYIRGKRVVHFEIIDVFVAIFGVLMLFGGLISSGGEASLMSALMYCGFILAYFLVVNMFKKREMIYRTLKLMVFSTTVISIIGIFQQGSSMINPSWIDMSMFANIGTRVTSLFDNPNMLSIYLIIIFPFALYTVATARGFKKKLFYSLCSASIVLCTVFTWSRGAWLGMIAAACVFLVVYNIKSIWGIALAFISLPIWSMVLPESVINRAISIGSVTDSSSVYRLYTWRGVVNMINDHLFAGIGVGESAFSEVYPIYSYAGTETVMHSHNLFLEITVEIGIVGLLVFLVIMFFFAQKCFVGIRERKRSGGSERSVIAAGLAGICGALVMGMTDHIWYNYRVFLLFWAVVALTCALVRITDSSKEKERARYTSNNQTADVDIEAQ